jgi:hypothetical protein
VSRAAHRHSCAVPTATSTPSLHLISLYREHLPLLHRCRHVERRQRRQCRVYPTRDGREPRPSTHQRRCQPRRSRGHRMHNGHICHAQACAMGTLLGRSYPWQLFKQDTGRTAQRPDWTGHHQRRRARGGCTEQMGAAGEEGQEHAGQPAYVCLCPAEE